MATRSKVVTSPSSVEARERTADSIAGGTKPKVAGSQSVYRALALLRSVGRHNVSGVTASELAEEQGLTLATAHRLLKVLAGEGMLAFDPFSKKYFLGFELYALGIEARHFALRDLIGSILQRIRDLTRETVFLFLRAEADSLCLERLDGDYPIRALTIAVGMRRPLGIGAGGLALLAALPDRQVEAVLRHNAPLYPGYSGIEPDEIRAAVAETRKSGFSCNDGRLLSGVRAVGVAIGSPGETPFAAVSIATREERADLKRREEFQSILEAELRRIEWPSFRMR